MHQFFKLILSAGLCQQSSLCIEILDILICRNQNTDTMDPLMVFLAVNASLHVRRIVVFLYLLTNYYQWIISSIGNKLLINQLMDEPTR